MLAAAATAFCNIAFSPRRCTLVDEFRKPEKSTPQALSIENDQSSSFLRVLVVDDNEPFRQFVCSILNTRPGLQIVGEASNGLEAVQKAEELQPDLILLDISLPGLNGIEAGRRIRKLSPESKILFVSQESSADVVQEALSIGGLGYVNKAQAGADLISAVEASLRGEKFVSKKLRDVDNPR